MSRKSGIIVVIIVVVLMGAGSLTFTVDERQLALVTQFGRFIHSVEDPGIHFKIPILHKVTYFDKRLLEYDSSPANIITKDKKSLVVDNFVRWRITNPRRFMETVRDEIGAQSRLDDIVYSELRVELARHELEEVISVNRAQIMEIVTERSNKKTQTYGIEVKDVRIKRADLPPENERAVFGRMRAEREREAKRYRSEGGEEAAKIRAQTDKERDILMADAYEKEQSIRGGGDSKSIRIYADAYSQDAEFYTFMRSLEAYKKSLKNKATLVLPADDPFLKYLRGGATRQGK